MLETIDIKIDEESLNEAQFMSKSFVNTESKNRAYINVLSAEVIKKFLSSNEINTEEIYDFHSISKFLEYLDIADIQLENIHIDVRAVFGENEILIPKAHYEFNIVPDIYVMIKISEDFEKIELLGYIQSDSIDKSNEYDDFFIISKDNLSNPEELIEFVKSYSKHSEEKSLTEEEFLKAREIYIQMADHDVENSDIAELISYAKSNEALRGCLLEFDNFEILSYNAASNMSEEELTNKIQNSDLEFFEPEENLDFENLTNNQDEEVVDNDLFNMEQDFKEGTLSEETEDATDKDEFSVFDADIFDITESSPALDEIPSETTEQNPEQKSEQELNQELEQALEEEEEEEESNNTEDISDQEYNFDEENLEPLPDIQDYDLEDLPEDINENIEDHEQDESDINTDIDLFDNENEEENAESLESEQESESEQEEENNFSIDDSTENNLLENEEDVPNIIEEADVPDLVSDDAITLTNYAGDLPSEEEMSLDTSENIEPESDETNDDAIILDNENIDDVNIEDLSIEEFQEAEQELEQESEIEPEEYNAEDLTETLIDDSADFFDDVPENTTLSEINEQEIIEESEQKDTQYLENEIIDAADIEEIRNNTAVFDKIENTVTISSVNPVIGEIPIDINEFSKLNKDETSQLEDLYNKSEDIKNQNLIKSTGILGKYYNNKNAGLAGILIILLIVGIIGFAATAIMKMNNKEVEEPTPVPVEEPAPKEPEPVDNIKAENVVNMDNTTSAPPAKGVVEDKQKPKVSSTIPARKLNESGDGAFIDIKKVSWEMPDYVLADNNFRQYFQTAGKSLKLSLMSDLLLATEAGYSPTANVSITYDKNGNFKDAKILLSSGSTQVDKIVLQTVNQTLKILKAPHSLGNNENTVVILKIYF